MSILHAIQSCNRPYVQAGTWPPPSLHGSRKDIEGVTTVPHAIVLRTAKAFVRLILSRPQSHCRGLMQASDFRHLWIWRLDTLCNSYCRSPRLLWHPRVFSRLRQPPLLFIHSLCSILKCGGQQQSSARIRSFVRFWRYLGRSILPRSLTQIGCRKKNSTRGNTHCPFNKQGHRGYMVACLAAI